MSAHEPSADAIDALGTRYRAGAAPEGFAARITAQVDVPARRAPLVPAALAAAVIAAVALVVSLPVGGPDPEMESPKWRVSAITPTRPDTQADTTAPLRVALSVTTPTRPMPDIEGTDEDTGG